MSKYVQYNDLNTVLTEYAAAIKERVIQYSTMPAAAAKDVDRIVQYIGETDANYTNGLFYKGIEDTTSGSSVYSWEEVPTQDISEKADKVNNATNGHLAGLDANGNLTDSGTDPTTIQPKTMSTPITVDGTEQTTVEGTLGALNTLAASNKTNKQNKTLDTALTIDNVNATTVEGALGTLNTKKINISEKGAASGIAELDSSGKVPSSQLPSYVDDVKEGYLNTTDGKFYEESTYVTEITPEADKIYIDKATNITYRWSGSAFVPIGSDLALGETSSTAYRGDRGKTAYDHSQSDHSSIAPAFTEASARSNIVSGDTFATILGKIKKFFADLKAVAFSGSASDVSYNNTTSGMTADNIQGAIDELASDAGGHTIQNPTGTDLAQEDTMQFVDASVTDDSTNGKTKVEVVRQITSSQLSSLTEDGIYQTTDEPDEPVAADLVGYDNTTSGLTATDVQDAIDELDSRTDNVAVKNANNNFSASQVFDAGLASTSTTSVVTRIEIGNNKAEGTQGCSHGILSIYDDATNRGNIYASHLSNSRSYALPDKSGTIALTSGGTFSGNIVIDRQDGTTSTEGQSAIQLGNTIAVGTDKNSTGIIYLCKGSNYTTIGLEALTGNRAIKFPDQSGTIALTSDLEGDTEVYVGAQTFNITLKRTPALIMFRPSDNDVRALVSVTKAGRADVLFCYKDLNTVIVNSCTGNVVNITTTQPCGYAVIY